ncbi:MAG: TonB-dependent receptor plug domain-containing protein [Vicinamibacterales bacterium]
MTVVSASRQEELREALNTRVDVVTRSRIDETGGHETVGEVLRELPGVVTRRGSETAGAAGEQIQGIDSRQILILIDGQPIVGARGIKRGGIINLDRQSTARLERVEVVNGSASALYGSDALGGTDVRGGLRHDLRGGFSALVTVDNLTDSQELVSLLSVKGQDRH